MRMSEDRLDALFSALGHPVRRSIVYYLAESGPQSYTALQQRLDIQTGTLNHHLSMLKGIVEQDENKKYLLTRDGHIAYQLMTITRDYLARPALPAIRRRTVVPTLRSAGLGLQKLVFHPAKAFSETQQHLGPYALCGAIVIALFVASIPSLSAYAVVRSLVGLLGVTLFCFAFVSLAFRKNPGLSRLAVSISMAYLPAIMLNILAHLFTTLEFQPQALLPFLFTGDPGYIVVMQIFAAMFIWRFVLLFFAVRESCMLPANQSFITVLASSVIENAVGIALDYLSTMPVVLA